MLEPLLPAHVDARWYRGIADAVSHADDVEVAWCDDGFADIVARAANLKWVFTIAAGVEHVPHALLQQRGIRLSNGSGLNAANVADYAVMGVLAAAKGFRHVLKAQERHEWLQVAPGLVELEGSKALIIGYGAIGQAVARRLSALGVEVTGVRSKADASAGIWGPADWPAHVGAFDWIVIAAPATADTKALIGFDEIRSMKPTAWLVNVARGDLVLREALFEALDARRIGGAFLDVTDPEPLAPDDPLWDLPNCIVTMHLSGRSQTGLLARAARFFVANLQRYLSGAWLENEIDLG
jgi:phosphoglycerate dehydrogenase-like enzyme